MEQQKCVYIADDDSDDLDLLKEALFAASSNIEFATFGNGISVLERLNSIDPSLFPALIIADYNMPKMNGLETLRAICADERYKGIPVVIVSTCSEQKTMVECKNNGAVEFFVKPNFARQYADIARKILHLIGI
jgi:CheY-like chemotaxis protein